MTAFPPERAEAEYEVRPSSISHARPKRQRTGAVQNLADFPAAPVVAKRGADRLRVLHRGLLTVARDFGWQFEAWSVFSNHYHFIAHSPVDKPTAESLGLMLKTLHVKTSGWVNRLDHTRAAGVVQFPGNAFELSEVVLRATELYAPEPSETRFGASDQPNPWCSAAWFERTASAAQVKTIYRFKTDKLAVPDDFDPAPEW